MEVEAKLEAQTEFFGSLKKLAAKAVKAAGPMLSKVAGAASAFGGGASGGSDSSHLMNL